MELSIHIYFSRKNEFVKSLSNVISFQNNWNYIFRELIWMTSFESNNWCFEIFAWSLTKYDWKFMELNTQVNFLKAFSQLVLSVLSGWNNGLKWETYLILMFFDIFRNFLAWFPKHVYAANLKTSKSNGIFSNIQNSLRQI